MKNVRCEKLFENLLNVEEEIIANSYEIDNAQKLKIYIKKNNENRKKHFYTTFAFRKGVAVAACLILGVAFLGAKLLPKVQKDDGGGSENKAVYVYADSDDSFEFDSENIKSLKEKFISPLLQEKMKAYSGTDAVYRVIVQPFIAIEDMNSFTIVDEEVLLIYNQLISAWENYEKIRNELRDDLAKENDPERRKEIFNKIGDARAAAQELRQKYEERQRTLETEYYGNIINDRLDYAGKLSETAPILTTEVGGEYMSPNALIMDLTAESINNLAEKGGYRIRLASFPDESTPYWEQE